MLKKQTIQLFLCKIHKMMHRPVQQTAPWKIRHIIICILHYNMEGLLVKKHNGVRRSEIQNCRVMGWQPGRNAGE
ncbi:hypothetical protein CHH53_13495 [Terribacillus sp. 7520-G]|nr:hypothetical protein CHH53_13495 [Terribacillus sp. 7520-G]